jgi:tRNA uridine 5-carboxymethylaminomethyl modification enzyme
MKYGHQLGLITDSQIQLINEKDSLIQKAISLFGSFTLRAKEINPFLESKGSAGIDSAESVSKLCKRPELNLAEILKLIDNGSLPVIKQLLSDKKSLEQVEIELKYEGYIKRQFEMVAKFERYEEHGIPLTLNYLSIKALSTEGMEKLHKVKPRSLGQAIRIPGVTPSDISILLVYLKN